MSIAWQKQLYELWYKAGLLKDKKIPESSKTLKARFATLKTKAENSSNEWFAAEKPKANDRNIKPLTERGTKLDRAMQTLDG